MALDGQHQPSTQCIQRWPAQRALASPRVASQVCSFDESMARVKAAVFTSRIRVKDFLCDFDRLRSGVIHENHFISGLSIAGLDKTLSPQHIGTIVDAYRVQVTASLSMIDWLSFVEDVERIFTTKARPSTPLHRTWRSGELCCARGSSRRRRVESDVLWHGRRG